MYNDLRAVTFWLSNCHFLQTLFQEVQWNSLCCCFPTTHYVLSDNPSRPKKLATLNNVLMCLRFSVISFNLVVHSSEAIDKVLLSDILLKLPQALIDDKCLSLWYCWKIKAPFLKSFVNKCSTSHFLTFQQNVFWRISASETNYLPFLNIQSIHVAYTNSEKICTHLLKDSWWMISSTGSKGESVFIFLKWGLFSTGSIFCEPSWFSNNLELVAELWPKVSFSYTSISLTFKSISLYLDFSKEKKNLTVFDFFCCIIFKLLRTAKH